MFDLDVCSREVMMDRLRSSLQGMARPQLNGALIGEPFEFHDSVSFA